jgi:hypothetical protein
MLVPVLVLTAVVAAGPRVSSLGARVGAGTSHEFGDREYAGFASSRLTLGLEMSSVFDLDVPYGFSWREGRTPSHQLGALGRFQVSEPVEVEVSLFGSPLGRQESTQACFLIQGSTECAQTEERIGFISPGVGLVYTTDPERDVVLALNPSAEMTWNHLNYRLVSGPRTGQDRALTIQELRVGMGADVTFFARLGLGVRGDYFVLVDDTDPDRLPSREPRAPAEQPLSPRRFEVGPALSYDISRAVRARLSGGYAPYRDECLGHNRHATLRLSVRPGRVGFFGQGTYEVDASPRGARTLAACGLEGAPPDFETFSFGFGATLYF